MSYWRLVKLFEHIGLIKVQKELVIARQVAPGGFFAA
jgi:hypothetical protein